ncbi:MAG: hypothetical protein ACRDTX_26580 [Pseudonocardiaceae bacterium]
MNTEQLLPGPRDTTALQQVACHRSIDRPGAPELDSRAVSALIKQPYCRVREGYGWAATQCGVVSRTQGREIDRHTQALREIDVMARDLIVIMEGVEPDSFELMVDITMPGAAAEHLRRAEHLRAEAAKAQSDAAAEVRAAAAELRGSGARCETSASCSACHTSGQTSSPSRADVAGLALNAAEAHAMLGQQRSCENSH